MTAPFTTLITPTELAALLDASGPPPVVIDTCATGAGLDIDTGLATMRPPGASARPTASTETASATSARSGMRKLKRLR